ncbi:MAG: AMP-binding protein [Candidatus Aenigmarchaeota archaeon]|nr:AMP-binding protein [Candidatus Aenigmarchaeota archaeon]
MHDDVQALVNEEIKEKIQDVLDNKKDPVERWEYFKQIAIGNKLSFEVHEALYKLAYLDWNSDIPKPVWIPTKEQIENSNIGKLMKSLNYTDYKKFHKWASDNREEFWKTMIEKLGIVFSHSYSKIMDGTVQEPLWLKDAKMNIVDSCFKADKDKIAVIYKKNRLIKKVSYDQLEKLVNRIANSLINIGMEKGDNIAIDMPMTYESVAIYLGIIKAGMSVVCIADSFAIDEISTRVRIGNAKLIFTQDFNVLRDKQIDIYEKVKLSESPRAVVLFFDKEENRTLRENDLSWNDFLVSNDEFESVKMNPYDNSTILFSSGTTGDPKAIPWTHSTPIKCASDGYLHINITENTVASWPTNLGWMMGPWLIYSTLINNATMALYPIAASEREFCEFIQDSKVTMLGVVPSLVKAWRLNKVAEGLDWDNIQLFASTGEASNESDYFYLMSLVGYNPVIEYLGGTEIGGAHITGTVVQYSSPATFSTIALGLDAVILDEYGVEIKKGELFINPPSIGLSSTLLNKDHKKVYFDGCPRGLRRHGDEIEKFSNGYFKAHGRVDDSMNLGGVKVSSADIERCVMKHPDVMDAASIGISPKDGGPSNLVIYIVLKNNFKTNQYILKKELQGLIKEKLNPLFKIYDIVITNSLPRTASNKVMRRVLRDMYSK